MSIIPKLIKEKGNGVSESDSGASFSHFLFFLLTTLCHCIIIKQNKEPMSKSSNPDSVLPESREWWNRDNISQGEWTCEGKPKSVFSDVGATASDRYPGTCMTVHG